MDDSPLVSVFIPVYNAEPFVAQAIESVLAQTYQHYELIVVNDGSTDGTAEVIARYQDHHRVRIHHNPTNLGMAPNWNVGLRLAQGDLVAKLDADDFYEPNFLEEIVPVFQKHPAVGLVFSGVNLIHGNDRITQERRYLTSWVGSGRKFLRQLLQACVIRSPTVCVRRVCYEYLGGFLPEMKLHADWEMWVRIAAHYDVGYIAKHLALYRLPYGDSCTSQAYRDERSIDDLRLWLSLLEQDALPYHMNEVELSLLREGMYGLVMTFAVYAMDLDLTESVQLYLSFAETLLPGGTKGSPYARLYTWAAAVYLAERRGRARACSFLLKSLSHGLPYQEWWRIFKIWLTRWCVREAIRLLDWNNERFPNSGHDNGSEGPYVIESRAVVN
jgi:glycosyltransferase involved in cell wall biosynthesis